MAKLPREEIEKIVKRDLPGWKVVIPQPIPHKRRTADVKTILPKRKVKILDADGRIIGSQG